MNKISVVVITLNEEKNLKRCLNSVKGLADEVLIYDGYSKDHTLSIAKEMNASIFQGEWLGYGATKNKANTLAKNDWILSLDADEALSDELKNQILQIKSKLQGVYQFKRKTNYCGQWINYSGWYPDIKTRLFNRNEANWSLTPVHETLQFEGKATLLSGDLLHYSYYQVNEHKNRAKKYAQKAAESLTKQAWLVLIFKLLFSPLFRFLKMFVAKRGFLDGKNGWHIARITAYEVILKYYLALKQKVIKQ